MADELAQELVRLAHAALPLWVTLLVLLVSAVLLVLARHLPPPPRLRPPPDPDPGLRPSQPDDPSGPASASQWGTDHDPDDRPPG